MGSSLRPSLRTVTRLSVLALLLLTTATPPAASGTNSKGETPTASMHEVRLRKLHLVRPDLIPYPIAYEVVC